MEHIQEYIDQTVALEEKVTDVIQSLNKNSDYIQKLTEELERLSTHFTRSDELIKIIQNYSERLAEDILRLRDSCTQYETQIEHMSTRLVSFSEILESLVGNLQHIQDHAHLFIASAKSLANLAKNTEIRAHHAKGEGKGLAVIAKKCLALAERAQIPFRDITTMLKSLEQIANPVIRELRNTIELSSRSRELLKQSFTSIETIDSTAESLQNIISQLKKSSSLNSRLKETVSEDLVDLEKQHLSSLNILDDISIHCAQVNSHAKTLGLLSDIIAHVPDREHNDGASTCEYQYNFFLQENTRTIAKLSFKKQPPLFPEKIVKSITDLITQIEHLYQSLRVLTEYKENLGAGITQIIDLAVQIEGFFTDIEKIYDRLHNLSPRLSEEMKNIDYLVTATDKIFRRIKTLSVYAKIEEGKSKQYRGTISPIVDEFVQLEVETERAFTNIVPLLQQIKKNIKLLSRESMITYPGSLKPPDYSKIKLYLDDLTRVFAEEKKQSDEISRTNQQLEQDNSVLSAVWSEFEEVLEYIVAASNTLPSVDISPDRHAPAVITAPKEIAIPLASEPLTLHPDQTTDAESHQVVYNFSAGLFQFGEGADIIPGLCQDYIVSQDGQEYRFTIRPDLRYQNGKPVRIDDFKWAIQNVLTGPNRSYFDMIRGASNRNQKEREDHPGIEVVSDTTIKIMLEYPFLPILANLATNLADPYLDEDLPIGIGPFRILDWKKGNRIILRANEYYFEGRPSIDLLNFLIIKDENQQYELFKEHSLSVIQPRGDVLKRMRAETPQLLHTVPEFAVEYLCFNCKKDPFSRKVVRQAIAYAIDTRELVASTLKDSAIAATGIFPPSMKVFDPAQRGYHFNPDTSRQLLKDAGFPNGLPDRYTLDISDAVETEQTAAFIKSSLEAIGIYIDINPMPWDELTEKICSGDSIIALDGWVNDNGDPDNFVYPLFHSSSHGHSGNTFFFSSQEIDEDIDRARKIRNTNQRINTYREIEKKILEQAPGVFLCHGVHNIAVHRDILGMKPHPLGLLRLKYIYPSRTRKRPEDYQNIQKTRPKNTVSSKS